MQLGLETEGHSPVADGSREDNTKHNKMIAEDEDACWEGGHHNL